ncbi:MAG TPA: MFS transporter [Streptosporangiaceae bacterium]|nr:MFS transporter [Streptosporangiaceae bacterium]
MTPSDSRRWWALAALSLSVLVVALDLFVLTLALPTLSADLHASSGDLQWFLDAYSLVLAAALLPAGLLGDRVGRKRLLTGALVLFGIASLACAYATSAGELIAARAVLGLAAAVILPMSLAVLPVLFTNEERPRAIAAVGGATFLGYPIGPILGGWLLDHFWWGSVFLINIPVVAIAVAAVALLMPESRGERRQRVDFIGIAVSSVGLTSLTYGLIKAGGDGWTDQTAVTAMAAGAAVLVAFMGWERWVSRPRTAGQAGARAERKLLPLVDLGLFRSAGFTWGTTLSTLVSFALFGLVFAMPQYFLDVRGADSLGAGLRMLPMIGGLALGLAVGQRLQMQRKADRRAAATPGLVSPKLLVAIGFAIMAAALAVGAGTTATSTTGFAATWFAVTGFGLGIAMPTAMNAALGALSPARSGSGSALITAMRQVGGTIGVAVLGTVLATVYRSKLPLTGLPAVAEHAIRSSVAGGVATARATGSQTLLELVRGAYVHGLDVMLWACSGIAIAAALLALAFLPGRADPAPGGDEGAADGRDPIHGRHAAESPLDESRMTA